MGCSETMLPQDLMIGEYQVYQVLSQKNGSAVFLGLNPSTRQHTVLKVLSYPRAHVQEDVEDFLREAYIIQTANHPNIVKLYYQGRWDGGLYMALEHIQGFSLRDMIREYPISLNKTVTIILGIARVLEHLHALNIIHKDIKPENIMICADGQIKLIDFGLSSLKDTHICKAGFKGTPFYMSPEQKNSEPISFASDIYSLGLIAYEMLIGNFALGKVILSLIPEGIGKIIAKALQPEEKNRYNRITDFIKDLETYSLSDQISVDKRGQDLSAEWFEELTVARRQMMTAQLPTTGCLEAKVFSTNNYFQENVFYEAFIRDDNYTICLIEDTGNRAIGLFSLGIIKGLLENLMAETNPLTAIKSLNDKIKAQNLPLSENGFLCSCLTISKDKELSWISCGSKQLWLNQGENIQQYKTNCDNLGIVDSSAIIETKVAWEIGDQAILHFLWSSNISTLSSDTIFIELKDRLQTDIFCSIDSIRHRAVGQESPHAVTFISLKRIR